VNKLRLLLTETIVWFIIKLLKLAEFIAIKEEEEDAETN